MRVVGIASVLLWVLTLGCGGKEDEHHGTPAGKSGAPGAKKDPFAALGAEDARLAEAQGTCPVSEDELGDMGTPIKIGVNGRTVFLCCEGCREKILKDPDTYLAKLDKAK